MSAIFSDFSYFEIKPEMRDVLAKMRECGKQAKTRDFPHDCGTVDTYVLNMMFKYTYGKEKYTEILPEHFKKALQFRIGSHKLPVNNHKHFNVPRADRHCTHCDQSLMGDEIHFLYECTKLNNLRVKYMSSPGIRREPNVFNFVNIMQTNDPETIGNLAKFILHGLKLYT